MAAGLVFDAGWEAELLTPEEPMSVLEAIGFGAVILWVWWLTRTAGEIKEGVKYVADMVSDDDDELEEGSDDDPDPEGPDDDTPEEFVPLKVVGEK